MSDWDPEKKELWHEYKVVVRGFRKWLEAAGWTVEVEKDDIDVIATRGDEKIFAEAKGETKGRPGVGLDMVFGQLLRRMTPERVADLGTRFAIVLPRKGKPAALRVPKGIRDSLRIDIYLVSDDGLVEELTD